jgi:hypothetical protein
LAVVLVVLAAPGVGADQPGGTFIDDDGSVHEASIEALATAGITSGCSESGPRFCPEEPVTRGQMAAFLRRALELPAATGDVAFADVAESVFASDVAAVADAGLVFGCDPPANTRFCPDALVTRGQMAAFLARSLPASGTEPVGRFVDITDSVFRPDIERIAAEGITQGCDPPDNQRFCPDDVVTRGQMATFLARALGLEVGEVVARPASVIVTSREGWGAAEPGDGFRTHEIERLTVHHSGALATAVSGPAAFRGWQAHHQSLGWPDLTYHFIVGRDGSAYEGRSFEWAGDTATDYDPSGHFLVVVEGDYRFDELSEEQFQTLAELLAWAAVHFGVSADTIAGHRDHASTICPGENIQALIDSGALTRRVQELIDQGGVGMVID